MRSVFAALLLSVCITCLAFGQESSLGVTTTPQTLVAVGAKASNYKLGIGLEAEGRLALPAIEWLTPVAAVGYAFVPLALGQSGYVAASNLSLVRGQLGVRPTLEIGERLALFAHLRGGAYIALLGGDSTSVTGGLSLSAGGGIGVALSPRFAAELAAGYETHLGLHDSLAVSLSLTSRVSGPGSASIPRKDFAPSGPAGNVDGYIEFSSVELERVFPVLYKYYDSHPIGSATIVNDGSRAVEDVEVRLSLRQFMDTPKVSARIDTLAPGEKANIDLYALFTDDILSATEGAKVAAELSANYTVNGRSGMDTSVETLDTYDRNALTWDDDQKIAAFVTARDDEVQRFARNIASVVDDRTIAAVARELQLAMALFVAMNEHECSYVVDPASAYAELSRDATVIDSVQFPRQTLQFRGGDCDDLSATYAALLQSVGVSTAFITVPGHIFTAVKLGGDPAEAAEAISRRNDVIQLSDGAWIPVETTMLEEGFLAAWAEGARAWREHSVRGQARIIPTEEAWQTYEPVAFGVSDYEVDIPPRNAVAGQFERELARFINVEIEGRERELRAQLENRPDNPRILNRLGVLYASYGRYEDAAEEFRAATRRRAYPPALTNLATISFLNEDFDAAREAYERVLAMDPDNAPAILGIARVEYLAEDYQAAEEAHARLTQLRPELAERFSYLGSAVATTGRAAEATQLRSTGVWEEEE